MIRAGGLALHGWRGVAPMERLSGITLLGLPLGTVAKLLFTVGGADFVQRPSARSGFTLVELLVVLLIVSIIAAVTLPVVIPAISHRQVGEAARIIQGGLVAARDASLRTNTPHGVRFLPDPTYNGLDPAAPLNINPLKILASNRFIPIEQPPGYSEGKLFIDVSNSYGDFNLAGRFVNYPGLASGVGLSDGGASTGGLYRSKRLLTVIQSAFRPVPGTSPTQYQQEAPTSWYWNVRAGDKVQINNLGPYFTVVGPMAVDNPEKFVNVDPNVPTLRLVAPITRAYYYPEYLFLVNGEDDDGDGYVDNGWDGVDNDQNDVIDDLGEWSEIENWPLAYAITAPDNVRGGPYSGVPYTIVRRPVPSPGARETVLPGTAVVDLTTALLNNPERSRLPVDPYSGNVDVMVDSGGRMVPTTRFSSPTSFGMAYSFYHVWVGERSDLAEVTTTDPNQALVSGYRFRLPMPLGRDAGANGPTAYDQLVGANATLPYLKGQIRLLSLSTRTGNMITTDSPTFDVSNVNQPYHAAQIGQLGETP